MTADDEEATVVATGTSTTATSTAGTRIADPTTATPRRRNPDAWLARMDTASRREAGTGRPPKLRSAFVLGLSRVGPELKQFFRRKEQVVFTFSFPAFILILLGSIFTDTFPETDTRASQVFTASIIAYGVLATSFINLGIGIADDRATGALKRLRGTPMPASSYFIGKIALVAIASAAEIVLLLAVGIVLFDLRLPRDTDRWLTFGWVFALGVISCSFLGIAISTLANNAQSAAAVTNLPAVGLQFLSGIFITPITTLPDWMLDTGSVFPVKWMGQGFRSVLLPDRMATHEAAGSWQHGKIALVLGIWCVVGLVVCLLTFRWTGRRER